MLMRLFLIVVIKFSPVYLSDHSLSVCLFFPCTKAAVKENAKRRELEEKKKRAKEREVSASLFEAVQNSR